MAQSLLGLALFPALAWVLGERRRTIPWRLLAAGLGLRSILAGTLATLMTGAMVGVVYY